MLRSNLLLGNSIPSSRRFHIYWRSLLRQEPRSVLTMTYNQKENRMSKIVKVGMVGTGFVGDIHHAAFKGWVHNAEVVAVSSPNNAGKFAEERGIPKSDRKS